VSISKKVLEAFKTRMEQHVVVQRQGNGFIEVKCNRCGREETLQTDGHVTTFEKWHSRALRKCNPRLVNPIRVGSDAWRQLRG